MPRLMREQTARGVRFCLPEIIDSEVRASCRVHGHGVVESDAAQGILEREAHELRFRIAQACRPARRTLGADDLPTVLDVRQMLLRDSEHFGKLSLRQGLSLPDGPEELGERERAATQVLEEGHCVRAATLRTRVLFFSRHGVSPLQPTQVGLRRRRESHNRAPLPAESYGPLTTSRSLQGLIVEARHASRRLQPVLLHGLDPRHEFAHNGSGTRRSCRRDRSARTTRVITTEEYTHEGYSSTNTPRRLRPISKALGHVAARRNGPSQLTTPPLQSRTTGSPSVGRRGSPTGAVPELGKPGGDEARTAPTRQFSPAPRTRLWRPGPPPAHDPSLSLN